MPEQTQIPVSQVVPAPSSWTVPGNVELILRCVNATFTDNGAASDWLPAVELISDSGHTIARAVDQGVKVTAGSDAEVSWFPGVKHASSSTGAAGSVISAYVQRQANDTFGPAASHAARFETLVTNDPTVFSFPTLFKVGMTHGGQLRCDCTGTFGTNGGVPYTGEFQMFVDVFDSLNNPVDELTGPAVAFAELYATDQGDFFRMTGTSTFNADDTFYTPPYTVLMFIDVNVNVTFFDYAMLVQIENPTGLT